MPYFVGGCTSLLSAAIRFPILLVAFGLAGLVHEVNAQAPGRMLGTDSVLESVQKQIVSERPELVKKFTDLQLSFDKLNAIPTEEQVRTVLDITDACTDATVKDVLSDPRRSRDVAWLLYLDVYSREGPDRADKLFIRSRGHTSQ